MLPGRQVAERRPGLRQSLATDIYLLPRCPGPQQEPPLEPLISYWRLCEVSGFCPLGQGPKRRTATPGAQGQGWTIINWGALLPRLPPGPDFPRKGRQRLSTPRTEPCLSLVGSWRGTDAGQVSLAGTGSPGAHAHLQTVSPTPYPLFPVSLLLSAYSLAPLRLLQGL